MEQGRGQTNYMKLAVAVWKKMQEDEPHKNRRDRIGREIEKGW